MTSAGAKVAKATEEGEAKAPVTATEGAGPEAVMARASKAPEAAAATGPARAPAAAAMEQVCWVEEEARATEGAVVTARGTEAATTAAVAAAVAMALVGPAMAAAGETVGGSAVEGSLAVSRVVAAEKGDLVMAAAVVKVQVMVEEPLGWAAAPKVVAAPVATMAGGKVAMREAARAEGTS